MNSSDGYDGSRGEAEQVVARLVADPGFMARRLADDVAEVAALGRVGASVDPGLSGERLVAAVRAQADLIGFASRTTAATAALRHLDTLPLSEGEGGSPIGPYHRSASRTVADGDLVRDSAAADGTRVLVFHRRGREPNHTAIVLEAVVQVSTTGAIHLSGYGWPVSVVQAPAVEFGGTVDGYLRQLRTDLSAAATVPARFGRAMLMAYGFTVASRRAATPDPATSDTAAREQVARLVVDHAGLLGGYLGRAVAVAHRGDLAAWTNACVRRSAAESLFEEFLGAAAFDLVNPNALDDLERAVAEAAAELPEPARRALVPAGTPVGHAWWWAAAPNQSR